MILRPTHSRAIMTAVITGRDSTAGYSTIARPHGRVVLYGARRSSVVKADVMRAVTADHGAQRSRNEHADPVAEVRLGSKALGSERANVFRFAPSMITLIFMSVFGTWGGH